MILRFKWTFANVGDKRTPLRGDAMIAVEMMITKMEEGYDRIKAATFACTSRFAAPSIIVAAMCFHPRADRAISDWPSDDRTQNPGKPASWRAVRRVQRGADEPEAVRLRILPE